MINNIEERKKRFKDIIIDLKNSKTSNVINIQRINYAEETVIAICDSTTDKLDSELKY